MRAWHAFLRGTVCTPVLAHMIGGEAPASIPGLLLHHLLYPLQRCDSVWGDEALMHLFHIPYI